MRTKKAEENNCVWGNSSSTEIIMNTLNESCAWNAIRMQIGIFFVRMQFLFSFVSNKLFLFHSLVFYSALLRFLLLLLLLPSFAFRTTGNLQTESLE